MSDETTPLIVGDAIAAELSEYPRRRWGWRKKKDRSPLTHCENCGAALNGPYCSQCGQAAIDYRRSFGTLVADAADAFFNLDARIMTTFALVLVKPWRLTNEFLAGRRHRYVHPLRLYLMASLAFFLLIKALEHNNVHPVKAGGPVVLGHATKGTSKLLPPAVPTPAPSSTASAAAPESENLAFQFTPNDHPKSPFEKWLKARVEEKIGPSGDRGELFLKALIDNLPYMVLCCIPLFALVLKILYIFKRRYYIEHLVFALHTHAYIFLSTLIIIGLGLFLDWKVPNLTGIVCVLLSFTVLAGLLIAIRRVYRQNWWATLFKFALGSAIYFCLLVLAFSVTAFVTLLLP